jgi:hypothetical protein
MAEPSKAAQRSMLILQFGRVMAPLIDLAERTTSPTIVDYRVVAARVRPDIDRWANDVSEFVTIGGIRFEHDYNDIVREPYNLCHEISNTTRSPVDLSRIHSVFRDRLKNCQSETLTSIDRVPIEWESRLLESRTPFTVYLHIRDAMNTAKQRIHYCDRYLDTDFFHLYLRGLSRSIQIRLVTTQGNANFGVNNVRAVSALAAAEFTDYQLIECQHTDLHDRNLRIDDQIFFLGPSINAAGTHPTNFSPTDSSPQAHAILDGMISDGSVIA